MAGDNEEDKPIKLDNAGTLNQSVSTSLVLEKVSIVGCTIVDYIHNAYILLATWT